MLWGYRSDEVVLPPVWPKNNPSNNDCITLDPSLKVKSVRANDRDRRLPVAGSLGMHLEGAACPHPDLTDTSTTLEGALYRVAPKIPGYDKHKLHFRKFVKTWCEENLKPLSPNSDTSTESWLEKTSYTLKRKEELLRKNRAIKDPFDKKLAFVKSFVKDEFYPDYKHARAINSRTDEYKTLVGPIFQLISDVIFSRSEFIKKVPIEKRPDVIMEDLYVQGEKIYFTDFSSFEAHFRKMVQEDCEMVMYDYMTQYLPEHEHFMKLISSLTGTNRIEFKNILLEIEAKRMSGEMNTSLGNGFSNLMFILYVAYLKHKSEKARLKLIDSPTEAQRKMLDTKHPDVKAKIEGDDSIFRSSVELTTEDFANMGLRIKLGSTYELNKASFCGMVFDIIDRTNVSDPKDVLATFGWTTAKYIRSKPSVHKTLLRCKALSLAYQYPSCPILSSLARNTLRLTRSFEVENFIEKQGRFVFNQYEIDVFKTALMKNKAGQLLFKEPGTNTRKLVDELYDISIAKQLEIEKHFDEMEEVGPLSGKIFLDIMPDSWMDYYNRYSANISPKQAVYEHPGPLWTKLKDEYKFI